MRRSQLRWKDSVPSLRFLISHDRTARADFRNQELKSTDYISSSAKSTRSQESGIEIEPMVPKLGQAEFDGTAAPESSREISR